MGGGSGTRVLGHPTTRKLAVGHPRPRSQNAPIYMCVYNFRGLSQNYFCIEKMCRLDKWQLQIFREMFLIRFMARSRRIKGSQPQLAPESSQGKVFTMKSVKIQFSLLVRFYMKRNEKVEQMDHYFNGMRPAILNEHNIDTLPALINQFVDEVKGEIEAWSEKRLWLDNGQNFGSLH